MNKTDFQKKWLPHIIALAAFLVLCGIYFYPALEGKVLKQHDIVMAKSMQQEIIKYQKMTGETILWTNAIFSGMPAYQIWMRYPSNISTYLMKILRLKFLPSPLGNFFLYFLGFYILLLVLGIRPIIAFMGGFAFAFSSYNVINIEAGHITKGLALAFAPMVLSGIILVFQGKKVGGLTLTALALALEIRANHIQITYYLFLVVLILMIVELIEYLKEKKFLEYLKNAGLLLIAVILAVSVNLAALWTTQEYARYSMRGGSELTGQKSNPSGLEKDYALSWSYGVGESFTLIVPNFKGGATTQALGPNSKLAQMGISPRNLKSVPTYWGKLNFTSGPIYMGVIVFFLFLMGMFLIKNRYKWWIFISAVLTLMLSWGSNFPLLTNLFFDYFPLYNKFRVPMTLLLIVCMMVPILSFWFVEEFLQNKYDKASFMKAFKYALYGTGGLLLIFILFSGSLFDYNAPIDETLKSNGWPVDVLREDRARLLRTDAFRSLVFVLITAGLLFLYQNKKIKLPVFSAILGLALLIDLWGVDKRYFNNEDFHRKGRKVKEQLVEMRPVDQLILQDPDPHYRVMDLTVNPWNDASPAYYHKFIGGYHGAKMARYQDMIEHCLTPELQQFVSVIQSGKQPDSSTTPTYNLLNAKYFILGKAANAVYMNPFASGNAWLAGQIVWAQDANDEMEKYKQTKSPYVAVVNKKFKDIVGNFEPRGTEGTIKLTEYHPNHISYEAELKQKSLVVFSEIFYDKGWNAYIDEKPVPHFRSHYILRALIVPQGRHQIQFRFEPRSYYAGEKVSLASSIVLALLVVLTIAQPFMNKKKTKS